MRLHGNHLSGPIPESLGGLPNLRVLSLHNNQLTGQIPKELAELGFLTELTLNDNSLTGEIPYTLGQAQDLEVVHVRGNRLSGCVPSSIEDVVEDYGEDRLIPLQQFELPMCSDLPLTDVLGSVHADNVEALYRDGVFKRTECGPRQFCLDQPVKRWEAAVWLVRVLDGKDPSDAGSAGWVDAFSGTWWAVHVARLDALGVEVGCVFGHVVPARCPDPWLTRAEAARTIGQAFGLEAAAPAGFEDTAGQKYAADIDALFAAGVTVGCVTEPLQYCPDRLVTRGHMAAFLNRARGN